MVHKLEQVAEDLGVTFEGWTLEQGQAYLTFAKDTQKIVVPIAQNELSLYSPAHLKQVLSFHL